MQRKSADLKQLARQTLTGQYGIPIGAFVVMVLIILLMSLPFYLMYLNNSTTTSSIVFYVASFIISLISSVLFVGYTYLHLNLARNKPYQFSDLFYGFTHHPDKFLIASLILSIISFIASLPQLIYSQLEDINLTAGISKLIIFVILYLFSLAVTIYAYLIFSQVYNLMIDNVEMKAIEAIKKSWRLMSGNKGRLFYIGLSFIGWIVLGLASCYIGFLWIVPYMESTMVFFYMDITGELDKSNDNYSFNNNSTINEYNNNLDMFK